MFPKPRVKSDHNPALEQMELLPSQEHSNGMLKQGTGQASSSQGTLE